MKLFGVFLFLISNLAFCNFEVKCWNNSGKEVLNIITYSEDDDSDIEDVASIDLNITTVVERDKIGGKAVKVHYMINGMCKVTNNKPVE